ADHTVEITHVKSSSRCVEIDSPYGIEAEDQGLKNSAAVGIEPKESIARIIQRKKRVSKTAGAIAKSVDSEQRRCVIIDHGAARRIQNIDLRTVYRDVVERCSGKRQTVS